MKKWLQSLNAGSETGPLIAIAVGAYLFGTPMIILLLVWALIARSEANHYSKLIDEVHQEAVKLTEHGKRKHRPEDEIRQQVLATWRDKGHR